MAAEPPDDAETVEGDPTPSRASFRLSSTTLPVRASPDAARYRLDGEIARGGLGVVTSAFDKKLGRRVAIKELHQRTEQGRLRFSREGVTTARLQHPAIVPILDTGTWDSGEPYLVMKLLEGKTLAEELATRTTVEDRLGLVPNLLAIADALGYAHERGVVHRDVKPANIMLGTHGETVLLDWGVAHDDGADETRDADAPLPDDAQLTVVGTVAGTVRYMSPEQARGEPATPAFDVYSLGATIATVLAGVPPFASSSASGTDDSPASAAMLATLRSGRGGLPPIPAGVPADLVAIVEKATAPPDARYGDAGELAEDLRRFIAGKLVAARRYSRRELALRWARRHRVLLAAGVVVAIIAVVAVRSVIVERNIAVAERETALAEKHALVLLQARAALRVDPTAAVAWLKDYPEDAPRQDEVLAILDEAVGRGVARHVWYGAASVAEATFTDDGGAIVSAHRDGELARARLDGGGRTSLVATGAPLRHVRTLGETVYAADDVALYRWSGGAFTRDPAKLPQRPTGVYRLSPSAVKVTYPEDQATYFGMDPVEAGDDAYFDDEIDAAITYGIAHDGDLTVADPKRRTLWHFAPESWVRSSADGSHYAVLEPRDGAVILWAGARRGGAPVEIARVRACEPGEDRERGAEVSDDGRVILLRRCGVTWGYDGARPIPIVEPDHVGVYEVSRDGRWIALGRTRGLELIDVATGAMRSLDGASAVNRAGFSPRGDWLFTSGAEQGLRAWRLAPIAAGRLAETTTSTRMFVSSRPGEVVITQHLRCLAWSVAEHRPIAAADLRAEDIRDPDNDDELWPWDVTDDGHACVFAGKGGAAIVVTAGGPPRRLEAGSPISECVFDHDGANPACVAGDHEVVTFDARGKVAARRTFAGAIRGLAGYRGRPFALVAGAGGCTLEWLDPARTRLGALPGDDCRTARGRWGGIFVDRRASTDVWTDHGIVTIGDGPRAIARDGRIAVAGELALELWDPATGTHRPVPAGHARAVSYLAWSATGILASADDETVRVLDPATDRVRVIAAPNVQAMAWVGDTLVTTDGRHVRDWTIDLARGASPAEVRARLSELTSARIVDGRAVTAP